MANKQKLNEFSLVTILGGIALFAFFSMLFGRLADNVDAYYHGRSVEIQRALKKILKSLYKNNTFLARIDDDAERMGVGGGLISAIMGYPELKSELNSYKNDKTINFEELKNELSKVLTKGIFEEAQDRGLIVNFEKQIKNTKWSN
ncbi:MAG: hypothetical protein EBS55_06505 [Flavobacteriaceae bacterium]|jgi:hypothetical protein|nr:hypothetical protein [Flavobacteriaceae bacterium]